MHISHKKRILEDIERCKKFIDGPDAEWVDRVARLRDGDYPLVSLPELLGDIKRIILEDIAHEERKKAGVADKYKALNALLKRCNKDYRNPLHYATPNGRGGVTICTGYILIDTSDYYDGLTMLPDTIKPIDYSKYYAWFDSVPQRTEVPFPSTGELKAAVMRIQAEHKGKKTKPQYYQFSLGDGLPDVDADQMLLLAPFGFNVYVFTGNDTAPILFVNDNGDRAVLMPLRKK